MGADLKHEFLLKGPFIPTMKLLVVSLLSWVATVSLRLAVVLMPLP